jgi:hypothetical protein
MLSESLCRLLYPTPFLEDVIGVDRLFELFSVGFPLRSLDSSPFSSSSLQGIVLALAKPGEHQRPRPRALTAPGLLHVSMFRKIEGEWD